MEIYMKRNMTKSLKLRVMVLLMLFTSSSCEEFVAVEPPKTEIISETVFNSDASAMAAVRGIYSLMMTNQSFTNGQIEKYCGLSADELTDVSGRNEQVEFEYNSLIPANAVVLKVFWQEAYSYIHNANALLEGLTKDTPITPETRRHLEGEARFIRAFCHYYLVNLFGEVPFVSSVDYRINAKVSRLPATQVYERILDDLFIAQSMLAPDYSFSRNQRTQPNSGAATALLSRIYLYMGDWPQAEAHATKLIENSGTYSLVSDLDDVFLANSREAIWQLEPVTPEQSTGQARLFILQAAPGDVVLRDDLVNSFEASDLRRNQWIGSFTVASDTYYFPHKYKVYSAASATEYATVLRVAEQYLIRAEARAHQDKITEAIADLDIIRNRAGLSSVMDGQAVMTKEDLLLLIERERRFEFFAEWGHRWFDLKRSGRIGDALSAIKQDWQETDKLYPIPHTERLANPLLTQNPGY